MYHSYSSTVPEVSIVIPVYQANPEYLIGTVRSVLEQTFPSWELILVDDACPDQSSLSVVQLLQSIGNLATVIRHVQNQGVSGARNTGTVLARGRYLAFLDQDDRLAHRFMEQCLTVLKAYPQIDVIRVTPEILVEVDEIRMDALTNSLMTTALIPRSVLLSVGGWPNDPIFSQNPYAGEDICLKSMIETRFVLKTMTDRLYYHRCGHGNHTDRFLRRSKVEGNQIVMTEGQEWDAKLSHLIARKCRDLSADPQTEIGIDPPEGGYEIVFRN